MGLDQFREDRKATDKAAAELSAAMAALQERLAAKLQDLLLSLELDGKNIVASQENIAKIAQIIAELKATMNDEQWLESVGKYIESFDDIEDAVIKYGRTLIDLDEPTMTAIKRHFQTAIAELLTNPSSFNKTLFSPIDRTLSTAVATRAELPSTAQASRDIIKGSEGGLGGVEATAEGEASTAVTVYERSATQQIADQAGSEFFYYQGRNIKTTREFCQERSGHAWHRKEIEAWASQDWPGKVDGTDAETIFIYLGGWYGERAVCRHVLVPIALRDVPSEDLERMRNKGLVS